MYILQMFERETRREKILEARNKELRLKEKTKGILGLGGGGGIIIGGGAGSGNAIANVANKAQGKPEIKDEKSEKEDADEPPPVEQEYEDPIVKAEREFFEIIKREQEARLAQRSQKQDPAQELE